MEIFNYLCETTLETGEKLTVTSFIEIGLNIIAQDMLWKHTDKEIDSFINRFKFRKQ